MQGLPDFCVTDQRNQKCLVDIEVSSTIYISCLSIVTNLEPGTPPPRAIIMLCKEGGGKPGIS